MANAYEVSAVDRIKAHQALDRWLDECERESHHAFESGRSGYLGSFEVQSHANDDGITLTLERSLSETL
jgi:hypothetical protein